MGQVRFKADHVVNRWRLKLPEFAVLAAMQGEQAPRFGLPGARPGALTTTQASPRPLTTL
jgi:hypothetical protein